MNTRIFSALAPALFVCLCPARATATFHFMQIERVICGVNDDTTAQAIQLRLRFPGETALQFARLRAWDATGANPVTLIDFDSSVANGALGARVLITSPNFTNHTDRPVSGDFTLTNLIPASYLAAGRITYEGDDGAIYWSLAFGGDSYTGPTTGMSFNDADGDFGPPFAGPCPSSTTQALWFPGSATDPSVTNADDYELTESFGTFMNNAGLSYRVIAGVPAVSIWGLVILTLLLGVAGTLVLFRGRLLPSSGSTASGR